MIDTQVVCASGERVVQVVEFVQREFWVRQGLEAIPQSKYGRRKTTKVALQRSRTSDRQLYDPKPSVLNPFSARPILTQQSSVSLSKD